MDQGKPKSAGPAGRIESGEGTLIGNAGEFYVAAELLKRGVIAAMPRNAPAFDILAAKGRKTVRVRVKTKSAEYTDSQWMVKKDGSIFRDLGQEDDFTVLVGLTPETKDLGFFVVPTSLLNGWLVADFEEWAGTPGKNGRPRDGSNRKRNLNYPRFAERPLSSWLGGHIEMKIPGEFHAAPFGVAGSSARLT